MNARIYTIPDMCTDSGLWCFSCNHEFWTHSSSSGSRLSSAEFIYVYIRHVEMIYGCYSRWTIPMISIDAICIGYQVECRCSENLRKHESIFVIIFSTSPFINSCNGQCIMFIHYDYHSLLPSFINGFLEYSSTFWIILNIRMRQEKSCSMNAKGKESLPIESDKCIPTQSCQKGCILIWKFLSSEYYSPILNCSGSDEEYMDSLLYLLCDWFDEYLDFFWWCEIWKWFCSDFYDCGPINV